MKHVSLGLQILIAALLGIFVGLFFGPLTSVLAPIGSAYTMLLQMAVLPYITFSLMHGFGSVTPETGKRIFRSAWPFLCSLWLFIFFLIYLLASFLPKTLSPIIISKDSSTIEGHFTQNFLYNLIPQNPFYDVLNNIVPAVAIFGLITGIALMHVKKKEPFIDVLERINQMIEKILVWLGQLSPIGVFCYISIAFGTTYFEDLFKTQIYVFVFIFSSLFIFFWLLPALISSLTSMSYKESLQSLRFVCLVPFFTGLSTAAFPFINSFLRQLSYKHETQTSFRDTSQTIVPIAYSFGHIGNAMILLFIFFLSYFYRHPFSWAEKGLLSLLTIPLSIGSSTGNINSILFLIDQLGFPEGAKNLYLGVKSFTNNFQILMSIASVFTLLLLTLYSYYGLLQIQWKKLLTRLGIPILILIFFALGARRVTHPNNAYKNLYMNLTLSEVIHHPVESEIIKPGEPSAPRSFPNPDLPRILAQISETKILKVGYFPYSIPYCYFNNEKQLVGYDVAYAYELARDLGCEIQFIPLLFENLANDLDTGVFDIGMSSIIMNEERLTKMQFSRPYMQENNVLVVNRSKRKDYIDLKTARSIKGLKIGAGGVQVSMAKKYFPNANIITVHSVESFMEGKLDALLWSRTSAIIWCLTNPDYVVIDYGTQLGTSYFAYSLRSHAINFEFFLNNWLSLKEQSGFKKEMEMYWLQGIAPAHKTPRWSILQNVLKGRGGNSDPL